MAELIQRSKPTLIGLPYDAGSSFLRGAARAPARIRDTLFSPATNRWSEAQFNILDEYLLFVPEKSDVRKVVAEKITYILQTGWIPLSLVGDHSLVFPLICAFGGSI